MTGRGKGRERDLSLLAHSSSGRKNMNREMYRAEVKNLKFCQGLGREELLLPRCLRGSWGETLYRPGRGWGLLSMLRLKKREAEKAE